MRYNNTWGLAISSAPTKSANSFANRIGLEKPDGLCVSNHNKYQQLQLESCELSGNDIWLLMQLYQLRDTLYIQKRIW